MSRVVMLSIRPEWCGLIAVRRKPLEVRKTKPKIPTPFKCYIYCTLDPKVQFWTGPRYSYADDHSHNQFDRCGNGKVIGDFVCDDIHAYQQGTFPTDFTLSDMCMPGSYFHKYRGAGTAYGWHISDLVIYDTPRELWEFRRPYDIKSPALAGVRLTRPPQSWCYVEEIKLSGAASAPRKK